MDPPKLRLRGGPPAWTGLRPHRPDPNPGPTATQLVCRGGRGPGAPRCPGPARATGPELPTTGGGAPAAAGPTAATRAGLATHPRRGCPDRAPHGAQRANRTCLHPGGHHQLGGELPPTHGARARTGPTHRQCRSPRAGPLGHRAAPCQEQSSLGAGADRRSGGGVAGGHGDGDPTGGPGPGVGPGGPGPTPQPGAARPQPGRPHQPWGCRSQGVAAGNRGVLSTPPGPHAGAQLSPAPAPGQPAGIPGPPVGIRGKPQPSRLHGPGLGPGHLEPLRWPRSPGMSVAPSPGSSGGV